MSTETTNNIIQNYQLLANETPSELKGLSYGIYPSDSAYNDVRFIYNKLFNYFPHAIFYPKSNNEIAYLIANLTAYKLEFAIRCGGHAYEPASLSIGYIIDVKNFSKIKINAAKHYATVGSGVRLGDLISTLGNKNYVTPTGEASDVGVSGLAMSGGKGDLTRLCGMTCDNILEAKIINYQGKILTANEKCNPDLFWAIKGAGIGNFGVVTQFKLRIYPDPKCKITKLTWTYTNNLATKLIQQYQNIIQQNSSDSIIDLNITYNNQHVSITMTFFVYGCSKLNEYVNEQIEILSNQNTPTISICKGYFSQITNCWVSTNNGLSPPFSKIKSTMVFEPIKLLGIYIILNSFDEMINSKLNLNYQVNLSQLGGAVLSGDSAYFPKTAIYTITILIQWTDPNLTSYCISSVNQTYGQLIPYTSVFCFPNMIDYDLPNYMNSYYGTNQSKLIDIKKTYDPNNLFNWRQSIPITK